MSSSFQYKPLEDPKSDIRLVQIDRGENDDPISCKITNIKSFQIQHSFYSALSYVWGEASGQFPISLNGQAFLVTSNLKSALRQFRYRNLFPVGTCSYLWIDALCIDQKNDREKDAQVRRMQLIYQSAYKVVVWLGDSQEPNDERVFSHQSVNGLQKV